MHPCVRELEGLAVGPVSQWLASCTAPFARSQLYSTRLEGKLIDETIRRSIARAIVDPELFDLCEPFVRAASAADPALDYMLLRNDASHIVYQPGDFFARHADYLSLRSNVVQEFTLIVSVDLPDPATCPTAPTASTTPTAPTAPTPGPTCVGGETVVYINSSTLVTSTATTTPGRALLFRKDLPHEGRPLVSGYKHILSLNLWATAKHSPQVLLVTFPTPRGASKKAPAELPLAGAAQGQEESMGQLGEDAAQAAGNGGGREGGAGAEAAAGSVPGAEGVPAAAADGSVLRHAKASNTYAIPTLNLLPDCFLARLVSLKARAAAAARGPPPAVVHYREENATYEEFGTVFRALSRMYVTPEEVRAQAALLEFHQIAACHLLVDEAGSRVGGAAAAAGESAAAGQELAAEGQTTPLATEDPQVLRNRLLSEATKGVQDWEEAAIPLCDSEIIVCTSDERKRVLNSMAKELGLPCVPFRVLLMEGHLGNGRKAERAGEMGAPLDMVPVFISLGDYDNVYGMRRVLLQSGSAFPEPSLNFQDYPLEKYLAKDSETRDPERPWRYLPLPVSPDVAALLVRPGTRLALYEGCESDDEEADLKRRRGLAVPADAVVLPYFNEDSHDGVLYLGLRAALATHGVPGAMPTVSAYFKQRVVGGIPSLLRTVLSAVWEPYSTLLSDANLVVLPDAAHSGSTAWGGAQGVGSQQPPQPQPRRITASSCFHIDAAGKACFTAEEAARASARVAAIDLPGRVRARVATTKFELPQQFSDVDHFFCNESVYGELRVVMVSGLVHMP